MHITKLYFFASLLATAYSSCRDDGPSWADRDKARDAAKSACEDTLSGTYTGKGASKTSCKSGTTGYWFSIKHIADGDRDLSAGECYGGLQKEIGGCEHGGKSSYTNWKYDAKPSPELNSCLRQGG